MREIILKPIREVRQRLNAQLRIRRLILGLGVCSIAMLGIAALAFELESRTLLFAAPVAVIGIALFLIPPSNSSSLVAAANAIDQRLGWKDSAVSALDFVQKETPSHMETLHINSAAESLREVQAKAIVSSSLSIVEWRHLATAAVCFAFWGIALAIWHPTTFQQPEVTIESITPPQLFFVTSQAKEYRSAEAGAETWPRQSSDAVGRQYLKTKFSRK
ncbi:MAG: hypothetical protein ACI9G1_005793 [Pirellulaceae bacterium]|jgi:hypothetical protein